MGEIDSRPDVYHLVFVLVDDECLHVALLIRSIANPSLGARHLTNLKDVAYEGVEIEFRPVVQIWSGLWDPFTSRRVHPVNFDLDPATQVVRDQRRELRGRRQATEALLPVGKYGCMELSRANPCRTTAQAI